MLALQQELASMRLQLNQAADKEAQLQKELSLKSQQVPPRPSDVSSAPAAPAASAPKPNVCVLDN